MADLYFLQRFSKLKEFENKASVYCVIKESKNQEQFPLPCRP